MVSVVIPTYNRAHLLARSINSVLKQSIDDIEIIVVDDGSTDNTQCLIESMNDKRIKYFKQEKSGACRARNIGIEESNGELIAFQDSDDEWFPNKLDSQLKYLKETNADFTFCEYYKITPEETKVVPDGLISKYLTLEQELEKNYVGTPTILMKKEVAKNIRFDETLKRFQDWDFTIKVLKNNYIVSYQNTPLMNAYDNGNSITNNQNYNECYEKFINKNLFLYIKHRKQFGACYMRLARYNSRHNNRKCAMKYLLRSIKYRPSFKTIMKMAITPLGLWKN